MTAGANPNLPDRVCAILGYNSHASTVRLSSPQDGNSPVMYAVENSNGKLLDLLLAQDADVNIAKVY